MRTETKQFDFSVLPETDPIYRVDLDGKRYYYKYLDEANVKIYASGTTIISDGYPDTSSALADWKLKMRLEGKDPDEYALFRASYGSIMHVLFKEIAIGKKIDFKNFKEYIEKLVIRIPKDHLEKIAIDHKLELYKDVLSYIQWLRDYKVKILAIEKMLASDVYDVATAVDNIVELEISEKGFFGDVYKTGAKKGQPKESKRFRRVIAVIDFKSGRKGFYDKHELQLLLNKNIVEENFKNLKVEKLYNFSPKDWKTTPGYNFKDQTNSSNIDIFEEVMSIGKKRHEKKEKNVTIIKDTIGIDDDLSKAFVQIPLSEYIVNLDGERFYAIKQMVGSKDFDTWCKEVTNEELSELADNLLIDDTEREPILNFVKQIWQRGKSK